MNPLVTITSLYGIKHPSKKDAQRLEKKLQECKDKYGDKLYHTITIGNVKEVKND
jgi:hypothetical protein